MLLTFNTHIPVGFPLVAAPMYSLLIGFHAVSLYFVNLTYISYGTRLWPFFLDYHMRFRLVVYQLSVFSLSTDRDVRIYPEILLTVGVVRWNKLPTQRQEKLSVNNEQLFIEIQW